MLQLNGGQIEELKAKMAEIGQATGKVDGEAAGTEAGLKIDIPAILAEAVEAAKAAAAKAAQIAKASEEAAEAQQIQVRYFEIIRFFIKSGADVNAAHKSSRITPLH